MQVGPRVDVLDAVGKSLRDVDVPADPFERSNLVLAALRLGHECLTLAERLTRWEIDPRYTDEALADKRPTNPVPPPVQPKPPPPPPTDAA